jgi:hypothetical protein
VLVGRVIEGMEDADRAAYAIEVELDEHADGLGPAVHDFGDAKRGQFGRLHGQCPLMASANHPPAGAPIRCACAKTAIPAGATLPAFIRRWFRDDGA